MGEARAHLDLVSCVFELEGSTDFVKEELRELRELVRARLLPLSPAEEEELDEAPDSNHTTEQESPGEPVRSENTVKTKKSKSRQTYTPKVIKIDLTGGGKNSLDAFVESKKPKSDMDKYEVVAYWLKTALNLEDVGPDLMYTCFKALKWRSPKDFGQPFRNAKSQHAAFDSGAQPGNYRLNHIGEIRVEHDMPPKKQ